MSCAAQREFVRLDQHQHNVKWLPKGAHVAEVERAHRNGQGLLWHFDAHAPLSHRGDVLGPLVDQKDV